MKEKFRIKDEKLEEIVRKALNQVGVSDSDADSVVEILVMADLMGISTHGSRRIIPYIERIRKGVINPAPDLKFKEESNSIAILDGDNGLGPVVARNAVSKAVELARNSGIAYVGCLNSNHFGPVAPYVMLGCKSELICLTGTNAFPTMAPWGGKKVLIGNNPLGVGIPRRDGPHFILDIAMSIAARGKIRKAVEKQEDIPTGWALDTDGNPTTNPVEALKGYVLPFGGHKGYGLALVMEVLSGVLTGAAFSTDIRSLFQNMDEPQGIGHFIIAIDPARIMSLEEYYDRIESLFTLVKNSDPVDPEKPVLLPGEIEARNYKKYKQEGIPFDKDIFNVLTNISEGNFNYSVPER